MTSMACPPRERQRDASLAGAVELLDHGSYKLSTLYVRRQPERARSDSRTQIPPRGRSVTAACVFTLSETGSIDQRRARIARMSTPSIQAKPSPMQRRGPALKRK